MAAAASAQVLRGPYLQRGSDSAITIQWRTSVATGSTVLYGTEPGALSLSASDPTLVTEHALTLSALLPGTRYYYAIELGGAVVAGGDLSTFFETSPEPGSLNATRIWVVGDSGTADANAAAVYDAYRAFTGKVYTDLWLMLGDNAYSDGTDAEYQAAVFDLYPELLAQTPLWPTLGNHDGLSADSATESGPYYDIFTLPRLGEVGGVPSGTEAYYSFDYANIHFVVLDSHQTDRSPTGAMLTWLEADLQDAVSQGTTDWLIAFWHHPPYSKGSHDSDIEGRLVEMRSNVVPMLETYGVDLVLSGHSHSYERSFLIDGHYGSSGSFGPSHTVDGGDGRPAGTGAYEKTTPGHGANEGAVYAVAGSSGKTSPGPLDHPAMFVSLNSLGSLVLDVNGAELSATFIDDTGTELDTFTIQKGPTPATGSVSGRIWHDVDADGVRDLGESDLSGISVALELGSGVPSASTSTDANGAYSFGGLNAGSYRVAVSPGARILTAMGQGADPSLDSDFDAATGSLALTLAAGEARTSVDAGLLDAFALGGPAVDLSDSAVAPYPSLDTASGTAESREGGTAYYTQGTRWIQTLASFDIDPATLLSFEFRSQLPGAPSAIGFDDDGDPSTALRVFDLSGSGAPFAHPIPQTYGGGGAWQTYQIPVGRFFTGNGLHLVLGVSTAFTNVEYVYVQDELVTVDGVSTGTSYGDTHDAELREEAPTTNFDLGTGSSDPEFTVDLDDPLGSGSEAQAVMRFDSIFGSAGWQMAPGSPIEAATLKIDIDNIGSDLALYELTSSFGPETSATWSSVGGGIDPATQTTNVPIALPGIGDRVSVDVTSSVQGWSDGNANHGWAFLSTGIVGVDFDASENSKPGDRPALTVLAAQAVGGPGETEIRNVNVPEPQPWLGLAAGCAMLALLANARRARAASLGLLVLHAALLAPDAARAHPEPDERIVELTAAIATEKDHATLLVERGRSWLDGRRFERALADFDAVPAGAPQRAAAHYHAAEALLALGRIEEALLRIEAFRARVRGNGAATTRALRLRARAHAAAGDHPRAARDWEALVARAPAPSPDDFIAWSRSLEASPRAALAALEIGLERLGPLASLERRAYALEMQAGLYAAASARAERWVEERAGNPFLLRYLAEAHARGGRAAEARDAWRQVIAAAADLPSQLRSPAMVALVAAAQRALSD